MIETTTTGHPAPNVVPFQKPNTARAPTKAPAKKAKTLTQKQQLAREVELMGACSDHLHAALQAMTADEARAMRHRIGPLLACLLQLKEDTADFVPVETAT